VGKYFRFGFSSKSNYSFTEGNQVGMYGVLQMSPILNPYNDADGNLKRVVKMPLDDSFVHKRVLLKI
jgi:TonB-dependent starch-binding outer membrane protein SusC